MSRPFFPVPLFVLTVLSLVSVTVAEEAQVQIQPTPMAQPGWDINYIDMEANFTANAQELTFSYNISSSRDYEYEIFEKDCSTEIEGNLITSTWSVEEPNLDGRDIFLFYKINMTAIPLSPIWNQTSEEMVMCLVLNLFEPATAADPKMIIAQDKHVITVGINSTVNFSLDNGFEDLN